MDKDRCPHCGKLVRCPKCGEPLPADQVTVLPQPVPLPHPNPVLPWRPTMPEGWVPVNQISHYELSGTPSGLHAYIADKPWLGYCQEYGA